MTHNLISGQNKSSKHNKFVALYFVCIYSVIFCTEPKPQVKHPLESRRQRYPSLSEYLLECDVQVVLIMSVVVYHMRAFLPRLLWVTLVHIDFTYSV